MAGNSKTDYSDEDMVADIGRGEMTLAEIGLKHGISVSMVCLIGSGQRRPELYPRIQAYAEGLADQARKLAKAYAVGAMKVLHELSQDAETPVEVRRRASMDILAHGVGDPSRPITTQTQNAFSGPAIAPDDLAAFYAGRSDDARAKAPEDPEKV